MDWAYQKYVESQKRVDQIKFSNIFMGYFVQYTTLKKIEDIDL